MSFPDWPAGTVVVLAVISEGRPRPIPVSTAQKAGEDAVLLALGPRRTVLAALREDPRVALCVHAEGAAFTLHGAASVVAEELPGAEGVVAVRVEVDEVQDHLSPRFAIDGGVPWHWTDDAAEEKDAAVRAALRRLGGG